MRLNLPNYRCVQFGLFSEFTVPIDGDANIQLLMNQTHTHDPAEGNEGGSQTALFGSRTRAGGVIHRVQGRLTKTPGLTDLSIELSVSSRRSSDNLRPPPRSFRPVSLLVRVASELFGSISVDCHAVFEYDQRLGYKSKIPFPFPLMVQGEADGITHIESAQFSRRDADDIEYQVMVVNREDSDLFVHSVNFDSTLELSLNSIRGLIDKAQSISNRLLIRAGGE